ncbi:hypothetical protein NQ315_016419 [Exocentrus adspersus]|uniref:Sodium channel protein Nach n=1 Tax=Exocentrus adspersus TaxID=1586481 RepID=A0AAV8VPJ4_9CUCU|nr:hypothetical protein NQ315_016419 [Exocentrus adspersus]
MNISVYEKIFWAVVNIVAITITAVWIQYLWSWYRTDSTFINFDGKITVQEIDFPGIAICNLNKISKRRAYAFAKELSPFLKQENISSIIEDVKLIGNLYDFNMHRQESFWKVQEIFDKYDNLTDFNDLTKRILELTTPCPEVLQQCKWEGKEYPCGQLFFTRLTFDGFCCVFNYIRPSKRSKFYGTRNDYTIPAEPYKSHGAGMRYGLEVVLSNDIDDYLYTTMATTGYKVHIFNCKDFPDVLSGSLQEILVSPGIHTLFSIELDVIRSTPQIESIPTHLRKCVFDSEIRTSFGTYTQSDCLVECKARTMRDLCNCIPFVLPFDPNNTKIKYDGVCSLIDIPCLSQYSRKWTKYYPIGLDSDYLNVEKQDSLYCECLPACDGVNYNIHTNVLPIASDDKNATKINVFFAQADGRLYKIDMTATWFEVISSYGGLMSLIMGLSIVSIIEVAVLLYKILAYYFYTLFKTL